MRDNEAQLLTLCVQNTLLYYWEKYSQKKERKEDLELQFFLFIFLFSQFPNSIYPEEVAELSVIDPDKFSFCVIKQKDLSFFIRVHS